jgi:hypothetical protein
MKELRYTLITDGPSDEVLLPLLSWLLRENGIRFAIQPAWAELRKLRKPPKKLSERIKVGLDLYPCDLLFIHRDAENETRDVRTTEIDKALKEATTSSKLPPTICVIPVRMQEAWLLFDEAALRRAAGNPAGRIKLRLPHISELEQLPDPKSILHNLIREASELSGRRRKRISVNKQARRLAELINDFSVLRELSAFSALESDVRNIIIKQGWKA